MTELDTVEDRTTAAPAGPGEAGEPVGPAGTFVEAPALEDDEPGLFPGDTGVLPFEARRVLALLLQRRYLAAADHPAEWTSLLTHQQVISSRLHDLFVELIVDRDYEIAFKRQVRPDGLSVPVLLKDEPYKRVETLLMLFVRNRFRQEQGAGQAAAYVDTEEMADYALGFLAHDETNLAARRREIDNAVAALARERVLDEVATGRYRILPVVEILLPVDRLRELTHWLRGDSAAPAEHPAPHALPDDDTAASPEETDA
ncbi:uncharacterized protein DUF4194 [Isoptericola sp. CG 20/1183]|uniref:Uncharacterized protein DUF4194 n=1 Tax=Isoptericola halotolerans TaxID=300560 RepID=A0ABX5EG31_9MICO|nr:MULTISPECIES: DUF4194 domain-containing protein [Isoptericola]PRZ05091.1 uncharacterized protein DUF4194 [Isoptericola halotolerans]PRZ05829.1 uncharacterized protein DUF4194 [Isoptericola sp. CG 20/1183]